MDFSPFSFLFFFLFLFLHHHISAANPHKTKLLKSQLLDQPTSHDGSSPTRYFEVTKPIKLPKTKPCSNHILHHDFAFAYGKSPVLANYTPPYHCPSREFSRIVLEWTATSKGRQFDRIVGVWLGGVELLRSCTAEPRPNGIVWTVEKDITRYSSLLIRNQTLAVYLGNVLDENHKGVYHVNITIHYYPAEKVFSYSGSKFKTLAPGYRSHADLIIPISRDLPLNDGLWFKIQNSSSAEHKLFKVPQNTYRAVLEVYVSFHEDDEFWYTNPPNVVIAAKNFSDMPGNGPFREVVISIDNEIVGAIWPFPVIYTGGVNPLLWRPITGIGSFSLPSYDIEVTPFLGNILDGSFHELRFSVTNATHVWFIDANLHVWLDRNSKKTQGKLLKHIGHPSQVSDFIDSSGTIWICARRSILASGWVKSSYGNITTNLIQEFSFNNSMVISDDENTQTVNQIIHSEDIVHANQPFSPRFAKETYRTFPLYLSTNKSVQGDGSSSYVTNVTLGFDERKFKSAGFGFSNNSLTNLQNGNGAMVVKDNLVVGGFGSTQQAYNYNQDNEACYSRNVASFNYTITGDEVRNSCF
ncbi:hypothetical protein L6164_022661 [Bauhinia variegata]|uniref:Uncharacterized protein n=1 Tax=Bauhinia variegata TaxID=167791 RepID=A0ACB9MFY0_BAUVA|nr:hypothetical protein L6164_022661 [Bauhinia variegata]